MEKTIGFIGRLPREQLFCDSDWIRHLLCRQVRLGYTRIVTGIDGYFERCCAAYALRVRRYVPAVRLTLVVTEREYRSYERPCPSRTMIGSPGATGIGSAEIFSIRPSSIRMFPRGTPPCR